MELTAAQRTRLLAELAEIEERLRDITAMLRLICKAKGIEP